MQETLIYYLLSLAISVLIISMMNPLARRYGWLDPPCDRKNHQAPTPPVGGFGVFLGIVLPAFVFSELNAETVGFAIAGFLLVVTGAVDDRMHINWKIRICIQALAALILIFVGGVRAEHVGPLFGFGDIELGWLSVPFTIFITVGLINALNMLDGIDGLLGMVSASVVLMFICAASYSGANDISSFLFGMLGALFGFLLFNFRFAKRRQALVFMGDAGSGFLGFSMAYIIFKLTQNPGHPISPILGPYLLALPIIDGIVLIANRIGRGQSPFIAGRDHAHYLMLDAGFTVNQVVLIFVFLSFASGLFGSICMLLNVPAPVMVNMYVIVVLSWFWVTKSPERTKKYLGKLYKTLYG